MMFAAAFLIAAASGGAPADVYFGRLKMSTLRIRYETMQVKAHYESHKLLPEQAEHLAELTQDAFTDWAHRYPHDSWLPSTAYLLAQLYEELPGQSARDRASQLLHYILTTAPKSAQAAPSRRQLHAGLPVRADPAWAVAMRAASAASPSPSASPSPNPSAPASPSPSPSPTASPAG